MSTANTVPYIFAGNTGNIPLSDLDANFANAKSAADFVIANVQANITQVGTLNGLNVLGEARADFFVGNGSQLTGVTGTVVGVLPSLEVSGAITTGSLEAGTTIQAFGNITSEGNIVALERIVAVGNVSGNYILGNGRALVGILYNANALVGNTLANNIENSSLTSVGVLSNLSVSGTVVGNIQSDNIAVANITAGNATAGFFIGDGSQLTNVVANTLGNITSINVPGNIVGGNLLSNGNLVIGGNARALGNVQGTFFIGNGSQLTGVTNYTNANVVTLLVSFGSNTISTSGNITAGRLFGNGSGITGLPPTYTDSDVAILLASFGGNSISTSGNVSAGNIEVQGQALFNQLNVAGNIIGDDFQTNSVSGASASFSGNVTVGNLITATAGVPTISSTGNLILTANGAVQVTSPLNANSTISATGNIITNGFFVGNLVGNISSSSNLVLSAAGEVQISELSVANTIFATGNIITDGFFVGNFVNVSTGNLNITGNIIDTGPLSIITGSNGNINLVPNGTGIVTTSSAVSVAGNISLSGNIIDSGALSISSTSNLVLSSPTVVNITGGGTFRLPQLTSAQIANIVAVNGDLVYNTTNNKIQGFENGAWGNLI